MKTVRTLFALSVVLLGIFLFIHRRVLRAFLTGEPMPAAPECHKHCCPCGKGA